MAIIKEYERQQGVQAFQGGRRAGAEDFGFAQGISDLAAGIHAGSDAINKYEVNRELSDAQVKLVEADSAWDENIRGMRSSATPGVSTAIQVKAGMSDYIKKMQDNYKTPEAKQYIAMHGAKMTNQAVNQSAAFDIDLNIKNRFVQIDKISEINERTVLADPSKYTDIKNKTMLEVESGIGVYNFPGDARHKVALQASMKSKIENLAYIAGQADIQNPAVRGALIGEVKSSAGGGNIIQSVIKREGGYVANDAGKGETNKGINATANPGENIKGMTDERATQIYREKYWDALGIGSLDPSVQAVVFDGAVNQGPEFGKKLASLAIGGATPQQIAEVRLARYQKLLDSDPKTYGEFERSWKARVAETAKEVGETASATEKPPELKQKPAWWDDLSAEKQIQITRAAQTLETQNQNIANRANAKLINDAENYFSAYGKMPGTAPKMSQVTHPEQRQELQTLYEASGKLAGIIDKPAAEQNAYLERNKPQDTGIPGDFTYQMSVYGKMVKYVQENQKLRQEDQVTAAYKMGFGGKQAEIQPIAEYTDGEKLGIDIAKRVAQTDAIQKTWNMKENKILMSNEAENIRTTFRTMKAEDQPRYLAGLSQNITKEHFNALAQQVWKGDHEVRGAAILSTFGDTKSQNGDSAARTSELILMGRKVLDANAVAEGGEKMPGFKGVLPSDESIREYVGEHLKGVRLPEAAIHAVSQTVKAHYVGKMQTKGVQKTYELTESDNQKALKDSMKSVIGEPSSVGPMKAVRPWGMSDSQFQEEVQNQASTMGYVKGTYGLISNGESKQYEIVVNGIGTKQVIDLNRPNYKRLQSGGDEIEQRSTHAIYSDALKLDSIKETLGLSNFKMPKGRADELGWWEK